jgi:hypothetical protein
MSAPPPVDLKALMAQGNTLKKTSYSTPGAQSTVKALDPSAVKAMEKVWNDCGGNYDKIAAALGGVEWKDGFGTKVIKPTNANQFATSLLQGRLTKD